MASPLAVSQLLDEGHQTFDVVIFDEASQVFPEDAVTSILRGRCAVVAGDRNQLPPTPFFVSATGTADEDETVADAEGTEGFESILDVFSGFCNPWALEWHYRSRDERLIAFSNEHIYGNSLITFPGTGLTSPIRHVLVDEQRGDVGLRSNGAEVEAVAGLVSEHARCRPDRSLGVIAMGLYHARRIEDAVDKRRRHEPELDRFLDREGLDKFFVKNLERVQGDERDCIILSIGYGKDSTGKLLYRFGPLLTKGGERRLNVAVTRAREYVTLVSSFNHLDMDPSRSNARGVELLREYLEYATSGGMRLATDGPTSVEADPFELDVQQTLTQRGLDLIPQYGCSAYRIDLVAKHPVKPGALVLAIECDGATYHSARMARDRDRLRQQHLEALGWNFCRIWSTDWFLRRQEETERVVKAYEDAVRRFDTQTKDTVRSPKADLTDANDGPVAIVARARPRGPLPPVPPGMDIASYSQRQLLDVVRWVQSDGLQRTNQEIAAAARQFLRLRNGSRIEAAIVQAIRLYWQSNPDRSVMSHTPPVIGGPTPRSEARTAPVQPPSLPASSSIVHPTTPPPSRFGATPRADQTRFVRPGSHSPAPSALPPQVAFQRRLDALVHRSVRCASPGCEHVGPPGTCPVHDVGPS
jgi:very-short-patch-repair endonuclease